MSRQQDWSRMTWTIYVCPACGSQRHHTGSCLDDPASLRPERVPFDVVSAKWRRLADDPFAPSLDNS